MKALIGFFLLLPQSCDVNEGQNLEMADIESSDIGRSDVGRSDVGPSDAGSLDVGPSDAGSSDVGSLADTHDTCSGTIVETKAECGARFVENFLTASGVY